MLWFSLLHFIVSYAVVCHAQSGFVWDVVDPEKSGYSLGFHSLETKFKCKSVPCKQKPLRRGIFHFVLGLEHASTYPIFVNRVCEALQHCMSPRNFLITMHSKNKNVLEIPKYNETSNLLNILGIKFDVDHREFTSNNKMMISLDQLYGIYRKNVYIYHTDLDEVPDEAELYQALKEMDNNECDAIRGKWRERVSLDGKPRAVSISGRKSLSEQYPYSCLISEKFMPERTTWKVLVYRSHYRLVSGQHDVWCNTDKGGTPWNGGNACRSHIRARIDKSTPMRDILLRIPKPSIKPRFCNTTVTINHFKFVDGVIESLVSRAEAYKNLKIAWWSQSANIAEKLKREGRFDVEDNQFNCKLVDV